MPVMEIRSVRYPRGLIKQATDQARAQQPDMPINVNGVIRYALALLAGLPPDQAAQELKRGHRKIDHYQ